MDSWHAIFGGHGLPIILVFGGFLFSVTSMLITRYNPPLRTRYILNFVAYYLLGPLAWGLLWYIESGNTNRFLFFTVTFWAFFLFFTIGTLIVNYASKRLGERNGHSG